MVNNCPLMKWYRFKGKCGITTCKAYSVNTRSKCGCMYIDQGSSIVPTDVDIAYYKSIPYNTVNNTKKKAVANVKALLLLLKYVHYIKDTQEEQTYNREHIQLDTYPLKIKILHFETWMLPVLVDEDIYQSFLLSLGNDLHKVKIKVKLNDMLNMSLKELCTFREDINRP